MGDDKGPTMHSGNSVSTSPRRQARHPRLIRCFAIQARALVFADIWVSEHIISLAPSFPHVRSTSLS